MKAFPFVLVLMLASASVISGHHSFAAHITDALILVHQLFQTTLEISSDFGTVPEQFTLE